MIDLKQIIRNIPDFPKPGILFRDLTPLFGHKDSFHQVISTLAERYKDQRVDLVAAVEARGFILGGALADRLGAGFVPIRKTGKLPASVYSIVYDLEYGTDSVEVHQDAVPKGSRVLLLDDLLATGGTLKGVLKLFQNFDYHLVEVAFVVELRGLKGREVLAPAPVFSIVEYE